MRARLTTVILLSLVVCGGAFAKSSGSATTTPIKDDTTFVFTTCNGDTGTMDVVIRGTQHTNTNASGGSGEVQNFEISGAGVGYPSGTRYVLHEISHYPLLHVSGPSDHVTSKSTHLTVFTAQGSGLVGFAQIDVTLVLNAQGDFVVTNFNVRDAGCLPEFE